MCARDGEWGREKAMRLLMCLPAGKKREIDDGGGTDLCIHALACIS